MTLRAGSVDDAASRVGGWRCEQGRWMALRAGSVDGAASRVGGWRCEQGRWMALRAGSVDGVASMVGGWCSRRFCRSRITANVLTLGFHELPHVNSVSGILGHVISLYHQTIPSFADNSEWGRVERSAQFVGFLLLNQHPVAHLYLRVASTSSHIGVYF